MGHDIRELNWPYLETVHDPLEWERLASQLESDGVRVTEIHGYVLKTNVSVVGDNSPEALRAMLGAAGIGHVFLENLEVTPEDVKISGYDTAAFDQITIEAMRDRIDDFNSKAERTVERCSDVKVVFAVVGELPIGIVMVDPEVAELLAKDAHKVLEDIVAWNGHKVDEAQADEVKRISELSAELKEKILADPRFLRCGNKTDRKTYARTIWDDKDLQRFRDVFRLPSGRAVLYLCQGFVEDVYQESIGYSGEVSVLGEKVCKL